MSRHTDAAPPLTGRSPDLASLQMAFPAAKYPKPIDDVLTLPEALAAWARTPTRVSGNLADGQPPMPAPWRSGMKLDGAQDVRSPVERARCCGAAPPHAAPKVLTRAASHGVSS
jgi:hypothetical protein